MLPTSIIAAMAPTPAKKIVKMEVAMAREIHRGRVTMIHEISKTSVHFKTASKQEMACIQRFGKIGILKKDRVFE